MTFVPAFLDGDPTKSNPRARMLDCEARPQAKHEDECRGLFGVCMLPKDTPPEGSCDCDVGYYDGHKMNPFEYTGCRIVGGKAWGKACKAKFLHITELPTFGKSGIWVNGGDTTWENNPFKKRFGNNWEKELRATMKASKVIWINDLVAHTVAEGNRIYRGSPWEDSWCIYHDALSSWWDPGAQALLRKLNMYHRQVRAWGPTSAPELMKDEILSDGRIKTHRLVNRYKDKLMGDSPEFMPCDRHLFNDLKLACKRNVSMTRNLPDEDSRKFWFNTPKRAFRSLAKSWQHSPTPERIVEDIFEFFESIDAVVESGGVYVDLNVRNGRRLLNFKEGDRKKKRVRPTRTKDASISKLNDLHPDAAWCGQRVVNTVAEGGLKVEAEGGDLKKEKPVVLDPEELEFTCTLDPLPENTMDLHNFVEAKAGQGAGGDGQRAQHGKKRKAKANKKEHSAAKPKRRKQAKPRHFEGFPKYQWKLPSFRSHDGI